MRNEKGKFFEYNRKMTELARNLRKNMTKEERHLWYDFLAQLPVKFKRQKVIDNYIVDFWCETLNLVVELDGSHHYEATEQILKDKERDKFLSELGFTVLRYTNRQINTEFRNVCEDIYNHLKL